MVQVLGQYTVSYNDYNPAPSLTLTTDENYDLHLLSYSTVVCNCVLGIMEVWGFLAQKSHPKPASHFKICLQINHKPFQQVVMKI